MFSLVHCIFIQYVTASSKFLFLGASREADEWGYNSLPSIRMTWKLKKTQWDVEIQLQEAGTIYLGVAAIIAGGEKTTYITPTPNGVSPLS